MLRQAADQTLAAARGAQDAFTFGLGDRVYASGGALMDVANGADLRDAWRRRMAAERARDRYDEQHYRAARMVGEVTGTGLGLLALGPLDAVLAGGARIAQATPMVAREAAVLAGLGAGGGVATQAFTDVQRGRVGSAGNYAGAAIGGATAALASTRGAPGQAAALGGATTAVAQDVLDGRSVNWQDVGRSAQTGGYVAAPLGIAGRAYSDSLSITAKGELGEALGRARTWINGDVPIQGPKKRFYLQNGLKYMYPDHLTKSGKITEQKFGSSAKLSANQRIGLGELGDRFRVDHFLPRDVGAILAYPFGLFGYEEASRERGAR